MTDFFVERTFDPPLTAGDVAEMARDADWCFKAHRVDWCGSYLAEGGRRMFCWFRGIDAESVRLALDGADLSVSWVGTACGSTDVTTPNVIVTRRFTSPMRRDDLVLRETQRAAALRALGIEHANTFVSLDGQRALCLYRAPDADSLRAADAAAGLPLESAWACERVGPAPPPRA
jgi:hypothetical protein